MNVDSGCAFLKKADSDSVQCYKDGHSEVLLCTAVCMRTLWHELYFAHRASWVIFN